MLTHDSGMKGLVKKLGIFPMDPVPVKLISVHYRCLSRLLTQDLYPAFLEFTVFHGNRENTER